MKHYSTIQLYPLELLKETNLLPQPWKKLALRLIHAVLSDVLDHAVGHQVPDGASTLGAVAACLLYTSDAADE